MQKRKKSLFLIFFNFLSVQNSHLAVQLFGVLMVFQKCQKVVFESFTSKIVSFYFFVSFDLRDKDGLSEQAKMSVFALTLIVNPAPLCL